METFKVLQARYSRVEFLFSSLLSFYHVRYKKVEMSPAGFNTNTLMTNNVCSMISCHCQNLVLMLQCYSPQGKGWQKQKGPFRTVPRFGRNSSNTASEPSIASYKTLHDKHGHFSTKIFDEIWCLRCFSRRLPKPSTVYNWKNNLIKSVLKCLVWAW